VAAIYEPWPSGIRRAAPRPPGTPAEVCCVSVLSTCAMELRRAGTGESQSGVSRLHPGGSTKMLDAKTMGRWGVAVGGVSNRSITDRADRARPSVRKPAVRVDPRVEPTFLPRQHLLATGCGAAAR